MGKRTKIVVGAVVAVVVVVVAVVVVYVLTRDEAPEAVDLEAAVARIEAADTPDDGSEATGGEASSDDGAAPQADASSDDDAAGTVGTAAADASTGDTGESTTGTEAAADDTSAEATSGATSDMTGPLEGTWTVQAAEGAVDLQVDPEVSFAGFRVDEVLAGGIGDFTAVGRTAEVSGSITLSGNTLVAATVEVSMSTLRTDNGSRDGQVRRALDTNGFPTATFTLVEPVGLPAGMADGEAFAGVARGDLTIKGVTNPAVFEVQAQMVGDSILVVGSSDVVFSDYGVTAPTAPIVVSVEDHGIMEFQLILTR